MALSNGQVVMLPNRGIGVIWNVRDIEAWVVPVWGANGPPRHRAEVHIETHNDILACGLPLRYPVVRCHMPYRVSLSRVGKPVGKVPTRLFALIMAAIHREAAAQAEEVRMQRAQSYRQTAGVLM